jgi:hypothetical protein
MAIRMVGSMRPYLAYTRGVLDYPTRGFFHLNGQTVTFLKRSKSNRPMTGFVTRSAIAPAKIGSQEQKCAA